MIVLDTNVVSEPSKPRADPNVLAWIGAQPFDDLYLCTPVVMEQYFGAEKRYLRDGTLKYRSLTDDIVSMRFRNRILPFEHPADRLAGELRARCEQNGRRLSIGDAIIAAICIVHGASLATRNVRDFAGLDVRLINPFEAQV